MFFHNLISKKVKIRSFAFHCLNTNQRAGLLFVILLSYSSILSANSNNYNNVSTSTTMVDCGTIDTDNDGIFDGCDWDDDNDGILDINEGFICAKTGVWMDISTGNDYIFESQIGTNLKVRITMKDGATYWDSGSFPYSGTFDATCSNFDTDYGPLPGEDGLQLLVGFQPSPMPNNIAEFYVDYLDSSNNPIALNDPRMHWAGIGGSAGVYGTSSNWTLKGSGTLTELSSQNEFTVNSNNSVLFDLIGIDVGALNDCNDGEGSGSIKIDGAIASFGFDVTMIDDWGNVDFTLGDGIDFIFEGCSEIDTDNDGVADHLDNDSDGDGCPDAVEGSDNFFIPHLDNNNRLSGNVDENGVPTIAGTYGQDVGTANDILISSEECDYCNSMSSEFVDSDNDGVGDLCDLDDDNDGILDENELGCLYSGELTWDHNEDGGTSYGGVADNNINSIFAWIDNITFGNGFNWPISVNEFILFGAESYTFPQAKTGNDFVQVGFTLNEDAYLTLLFHGLVNVAAGGAAAGDYQITATISDDDFETFDILYQDKIIYSPITTSYEISYNVLRQPRYLEPWKHYVIRLYLYNEQNGYVTDQTVAFDDLKLVLSTGCEVDIDRDGLPNQVDLDSDNDGIPDIVEAKGVDIDGNGIVDGIIDSDGDKIPDYADADFVGCTSGDATIPQDGICDDVQGPLDEDNDGIQDADDKDKNGNGVVDFYEPYVGITTLPQPDSDGDNVLDYYDLDADNDGIPDVVEAGGTDANGDGIADGFVDVDNDGFNDIVDGYLENSFVDNSSNSLILTGPDTDGNGFPNTYPNKDFDQDGFLNHLDLDADNDGIPDVVEAHGTDSDGDGRAENFIDTDHDGLADHIDGDSLNILVSGSDIMADNSSNALQLTGVDLDLDGAPDDYPEGDRDEDGQLDGLDLDADNDGIPDIVEALGADINGDGYVDNFDPTSNSFLLNTELDADGFSNFYDSDIDNNGVAGDVGVFPLITTSSDADYNGAPDNGMIGADLDGDTFANHLDLDADNDGILDIIEAGMEDSDSNGIADDALTNDVDKNGWSNSFDGNQGGKSTIEMTDTDNNGIPDAYITFNTDNNTNPNFIDIDADDDGIVDNTEAQLTDYYFTTSNLDTDKDGIDDQYDFIVGFGGEGITPANTDGFDEPDYLDLDADNDGELDALEGHDTNGDNIIDANDTPVAFSGMANSTMDADGDGLLDGFDNNNSSYDPTNNSLKPESHNDIDDPGGDRDWREGNCQLCKVNYAIQDGSNNLTTSIKTDPQTGENILNSDTYGKVRLTKYCLINGWRYYYNAAAPQEAMFAITGTDSDMDFIQYIEIRIGENQMDREAGNATAYTKLMNRDWFVKMKNTQANPMSIRFYFPESDFGINGYQTALTSAAGYGLSGSPEIRWWKTTDWDQFEPSNISADAANLVNQNGYVELTPSTTADRYTGTAATDGSIADVGNGKNYMQFDGLMNFSGGTAGFGVLGSALPVELTEFRGLVDDCKIHLTWTSVQSDLNGYYQVEWSADGENFESIEVLPRAHSFTSTQSYLFSHQTTFLRNYYRLKMVNHNGNYTYSDAIFLRTSCNKQYEMMVYPNPIGNERPEVQIEYYSESKEAKFTVINLMGQIVDEIIFESEKQEWNVKTIDVKGLPSGTYYIFHENNEQVTPFTIQE